VEEDTYGQEGSRARGNEESEGPPKRCWQEQWYEWTRSCESSLKHLHFFHILIPLFSFNTIRNGSKTKTTAMRRTIGTWINTDERKSKKTWIRRLNELRVCHYNMAKARVGVGGQSEFRMLYSVFLPCSRSLSLLCNSQPQCFADIVIQMQVSMHISSTMYIRMLQSFLSIDERLSVGTWRKLKTFYCHKKVQNQSSSSLP